MMLAPLFAQLAASGASVADLELETALWRLYEAGRSSLPQLAVTPEQFTRFLGRQLPAEATSPRELASLRAPDLYLVCALGLGDRAAQALCETEYMPRVRRALLQLGTSDAVIADIQQNLYARLIERTDETVERSGYSGRGELGNWLCTCAVREAGHRHKRGQRELALEQATEALLRDLRRDPETATLQGHLKEVFQESFKAAIASLSSRERNLLRYHFLAELSIDQIGALYKVHRATAARWVARAQEKLIEKTRELFVQRSQVNAESLPRIMELIASQLSVNLGNALKSTAENDPPAGGSSA